ncbi:MAG: hypothetical protein WCI73_20300, partial [Phycisphaerae bacterium]
WAAEKIVGIEGDEFVKLATDLVNLGLATVRDLRTLKLQLPGAKWLEYAITAKGTRLLAGLEAVEPLVADERIG